MTTLEETLGDRRPDELRPYERGEPIGRFVTIEHLGSGGMGVVYAAYDPDLDRKVAIKLLHGDGDTAGLPSEGRRRLLREAQALARVSHPNVVVVHDVGEHAGRVYLAMEYVEGRTLRRWLGERSRSWRTVLGVLLQAGRGLAAAHAAGIVHRDFKPENVLVAFDASGAELTTGRVRVSDFGLARSSEAATPRLPDRSGDDSTPIETTRAGALIGTPAYMAPEQHSGLVADASSDQFSFCVSAYEALYGTRPFVGSSVNALAVAIVEGQLQPVPTGTHVPTRVRRVLLRGLAAEPDDRFDSMDDLIAALERELGRTRTRWLGVAATAIAGVGVGATGMLHESTSPCEGATAKLEAVWDSDHSAAIESAFAATALPYALATFERLQEALDRYARSWIDAHVDACEATLVRGEQSDSLMDARIACLDGRLRQLDALVRVLAEADAPLVERSVRATSELPAIDRCSDRDYASSRTPEAMDPELAAAVEDVRDRLARVGALTSTGRFSEAVTEGRAALRRAESLDNADVLALARFRLGVALVKDGHYKEAVPLLEDAFFGARNIGDEEIGASSATSLVFVVGRRLARHAEGLAWSRHARAALAHAPDVTTQVRLLNNVGNVRLAMGDADEALQSYEEALALAQSELDGEGFNVGLSLNNVGLALEDLGELDRALEHYQRAYEVFERSLGTGHPHTAIPLNNIAAVAFARGDYDGAIELYRRVLAIREPVLAADHPSIAQTLNNLGNALHFSGRSAEALPLLERSTEVIEAAVGRDHPDVAMCLSNLGMVHRAMGHHEQALTYNRQALEIRERSLGPDHAQVAASHNNLASALRASGDLQGALRHYRRSAVIYETALSSNHVALAHPLTGSGQVLLDLGRPRDAIVDLERALALRTSHDVGHLELGDTRFALAQAVAQLRRSDPRARELAQEALQDFQASGSSANEQQRTVADWIEALPDPQ